MPEFGEAGAPAPGVRPLRILQVCRQYHPSVGGVERFVGDLAGRLAARGHHVEIATLNRLWRSWTVLPGREVVDGLTVHRLPFVGGASFFVAPTVFALAGNFDVLHVHNTDFFLDYLSLTRAIHGRPVIISTHGGFFHTQDRALIKSLYFRWVTRRSLRAAAAVIPNSGGDERRFGPHARHVVRVDNAIDYPAFAAVVRRPAPGRLVTIGRLSANKNVAGLLRVFAAARAGAPGLTLIVIGDGPLRGALQSLAVELGIAEAVSWLGEVDDRTLRAELARAEFYLSAAEYEGFGLALLEAMAAGVVPVVNRIEAFEELVADGECGVVVDFNRAPEAGRRLGQAVASSAADKTRLSEQARARAARYDWEEAMPKFERIYREAAKAAHSDS